MEMFVLSPRTNQHLFVFLFVSHHSVIGPYQSVLTNERSPCSPLQNMRRPKLAEVLGSYYQGELKIEHNRIVGV